MAITIYDFEHRASSGGASFDFTIDVGGSEKMLVARVCILDGFSVSSVVLNPGGSPQYFTKCGSVEGNDTRVEIWYLDAPADTMGATVTITLSGTTDFVGRVECLNGTATGAPSWDQNTGSGTQATAAIGAGDLENQCWMIDCVAFEDGRSSLSPAAGQTEDYEGASGSGAPDVAGGFGHLYHSGGEFGFVIKYDNTRSETWAYGVIVVEYAPSGITVTPSPQYSASAIGGNSPGVQHGSLTLANTGGSAAAIGGNSPTARMDSLTLSNIGESSFGMGGDVGSVVMGSLVLANTGGSAFGVGGGIGNTVHGSLLIQPVASALAIASAGATAVMGSLLIQPSPSAFAIGETTVVVVEGATGIIVTPDPSAFGVGGNLPPSVMSSVIYAPSPSALAVGSINPNVVAGSLIIVPTQPSVMSVAGSVGPVVHGSIYFAPVPSTFGIQSSGPSDVIFGSLVFAPTGHGFGVGTDVPIVELGSIVYSPTESSLSVATGGGSVLIGRPTSTHDVIEIVQRTFGAVVFDQKTVELIERTFGDAITERKSVELDIRKLDDEIEFHR